MSDTLKTSVKPADVAEALKKTGYRASLVEHERFPQVQSAAQGLGFFIGFGNAAVTDSASYIDYSFHCWITIQGDLPAGLIDGWNQSKRFARMYRQGQLLILTMDVLVSGGVTENFLCAQVELWDRIIHDFIRHLKQSAVRHAQAAQAAQAANGAAGTAAA